MTLSPPSRQKNIHLKYENLTTIKNACLNNNLTGFKQCLPLNKKNASKNWTSLFPKLFLVEVSKL